MSHTNGLSDMNDFEKPFRDVLTDLDATPPEGGWPPIKAALDHTGFDYRTYGFLLLLLLLIGVGSRVTYHVATHAVERQRAATAVQQAVPLDATSALVPSSAVAHTVEVPCAPSTPASDALASADAGSTPSGGYADYIPYARAEVACTPLVDAGEVYERHPANNARAQQRPAVPATGDATPAAPDASRRVIRRGYRGEAPTVTQRSVHTNAVAPTSGEEASQTSRRVDERGWKRGAAEDTVPFAWHTDRREPVVSAGNEEATRRGKDSGSGRGTEPDSVIRAHNGPPMPVRKRNTSSFDAVALTPFDSLEPMHAVKKKEKVSKPDSVEEKKRPDRERSKWSLHLQGGVNYTFKKMDPAKDLYYVTGLNNKNQASWQNAGYQLSATARYPLARRTTITAGFSWNMLREHTGYNYYNIIADSVEVKNIAGKSIEVNGYSKVRSNDVTNTLHYFGVHVGLIQQVTFLRRERSILLALHVNRQVAATHHTQNADHRFTVNDMRVALRAGLENRVALSPYHVLTLTPFLEQSFGSVYTGESVYTLRPIQLGLDVGLVLPFYKRK